jgi:DNA-binding transcriptional ArsR family regulator
LTLRNVVVTLKAVLQACEALADPIRREIVEVLAQGEQTAGDIAARFDVTRPAVSRHLRVLREAGIATVRGEATRRIYRLDPAPLLELEQWIVAQRTLWEHRLDELGSHLDRMAANEGDRT